MDLEKEIRQAARLLALAEREFAPIRKQYQEMQKRRSPYSVKAIEVRGSYMRQRIQVTTLKIKLKTLLARKRVRDHK